MAKHMKAGAVKVKLQFHGKRPELHVVFPVKFTEQLYRRLRPARPRAGADHAGGEFSVRNSEAY